MKKLPLFSLLLVLFYSPLYAEPYWVAADTVSLIRSGWAVGTAQDVFAELSGLSLGTPSQGIEWYFSKHWAGVDVGTYLDDWQGPDLLTLQEAIGSGDGIVLVYQNPLSAVGLTGTILDLSKVWYVDTLEPQPPPTNQTIPEPSIFLLLGMGGATLGLVRGQTRFWRSPAA